MISMRVPDRLRGAVRNRTFLSVRARSVDSSTVRPARCLKGLPAIRLSNIIPFNGKLTVLPSWSENRSSPLWNYKTPGLG